MTAGVARQGPFPESYACGRCGRRDGLDCVIPSQLWNAIEAETGHGVLCAWCLDAECHRRGWTVRALLAFVGRAISAGTEPDHADPHWERHLGDLTHRVFKADRREEAATDALRHLVEAAGHRVGCGFSACTCGTVERFAEALTAATRLLRARGRGDV